jgi:hypothetical protein
MIDITIAGDQTSSKIRANRRRSQRRQFQNGAKARDGEGGKSGEEAQRRGPDKPGSEFERAQREHHWFAVVMDGLL